MAGRDATGRDGAPRRVRLVRSIVVVACVGLAVSLVRAATATASSGRADRGGGLTLSITKSWTVPISAVIGKSSPMVATIGYTRVVLVGAHNGRVYALSLASGTTMPHWPFTTPGAKPVDSTPSVNGSIFYVGVGDAVDPQNGGYLAINAKGTRRWFTQIHRTPTDSLFSGVSASMAVGSLQGVRAVVAGSMGQQMDALNASTGRVLPGFPWPSTDSEFSSPAIADFYSNGKNHIISGAAQTAGYAYHHVYTAGGHIRVLRETGNLGATRPNGGVTCDITPNESVDSSPAVGRFLAGGAMGIVVGTGTQFQNVSDEDTLYAVTTRCTLAWSRHLDGGTTSSPALVDALGRPGGLQVAEGTASGTNSGTAYLLNAATGATIWSHNVAGHILGSITSADLGPSPGNGYQDLLVPTTHGLYILDGKTGAQIGSVLDPGLGLANAPLVTDDHGLIGITIAGTTSASTSEIVHYFVQGTDGALADEAGAWPMFHHDPQLTGTTLKPLLHG